MTELGLREIIGRQPGALRRSIEEWLFCKSCGVVLPVPRPVVTASRSSCAWKSGAIDSVMPEKTHVGLGFSVRVFPGQALADEIRGSSIHPRTAQAFPSPIRAKFSDP
jgi:hypothetical protein